MKFKHKKEGALCDTRRLYLVSGAAFIQIAIYLYSFSITSVKVDDCREDFSY